MEMSWPSSVRTSFKYTPGIYVYETAHIAQRIDVEAACGDGST